ncbi:hypothetical protein PCI56_03670 [Plesiomonas shigelloides subsp. oncorhynchi]|nr:hypothetical protein [Plesiomonas shigelloides]
MEINSDAIKSLFNGNVRIENVFIMQLISACDSMPDSFWSVFNDNHEEILKALGLSDTNISDYDDLSTKSDLLDFLYEKNIAGVLIQFATPVPSDFSFYDDGEFSSCASSWGMTSWHFSYGETVNEAINRAISDQDKYWNECLEKAKAECRRGL